MIHLGILYIHERKMYNINDHNNDENTNRWSGTNIKSKTEMTASVQENKPKHTRASKLTHFNMD